MQCRSWRDIFSWWFSASEIKQITKINPLFLCGTCYTTVAETDNFRESLSNVIWVTYRNNITSLANTTKLVGLTKSYKTDSGWGCMIRLILI